jgi:hypothetical protein
VLHGLKFVTAGGKHKKFEQIKDTITSHVATGRKTQRNPRTMLCSPAAFTKRKKEKKET